MSWLSEVLPELTADVGEVADRLTALGVEVERIERVGSDTSGVVTGRVLDVEELVGFKKPVRFVQVDVGGPEPRGVVCGARNFQAGDVVPVALPGAVLPGPFPISARTTYGRVSDGMICSAPELGMGGDGSGILVLPPGTPPGLSAVDLLGLREEVLDLTTTPDRGYQMSVRGITRELATAFGVPFTDPARGHDVELPTASGPAVLVEDPASCPRYVALLAEDLDPAAVSPVWLGRRVALAGMRSISLAVDATNAVMLGLGQPLHAFDADRLQLPLVVRRARSGERLVTLDGRDRALHVEDLVITDATGPVALAGVMGGLATEIGPDTTRVLLEAAVFDPVVVGRAARRHRLPSEASRRYERGVDAALPPAAARACADLLVEHAGARLGAATDVDHRADQPVIAFDLCVPGRIAGRDYPAAVVRQRLADVGCTGLDQASATVLQVRPPSWRPDLTGPTELAEEVIRLEGYDTVPIEVPRTPAATGLTHSQQLVRRAGRALAADGFVEVLSLPFVGTGDLERLGITDVRDPRLRTVAITNPLSEDAALLRPSLLPGLLGAVRRNVTRGQGDLALSEVGLVFRRRAQSPPAPRLRVDARPAELELAQLDAALPDQPRHLALVLAGARSPAGWWGPARPADWADALDGVRSVAIALRVPLEVHSDVVAPWHPGRCARLAVGDQVLGWAGELHPRVVATLGLPERTCAAEIDLDRLIAAAPVEPVPAPLLSTFPPADRDVAVVVRSEVPAADVVAALRAGAGPELEAIALFDVYRGPGLPDGHTSLAVSMRWRAADRTLTAQEVLERRDAALTAAAEQVGASLR